MPRYHVQFIFSTYSLRPEDRVMNTFAIGPTAPGADPLSEAAFDAWCDHLEDFYFADPPGGAAVEIADWLSGSNSLNGFGTIRWYNVDDPEPRAPVFERLWEHSLPTTAGLPNELAACLTFQGAPVSGTPTARRRGRIYIGPLNVNALGEGSGDLKIDEGLRNCMALAAAELASIRLGTTSSDHRWCVWSRADDEFVGIDQGWVDDAFDIQRRRGNVPSVRAPWVSS